MSRPLRSFCSLNLLAPGQGDSQPDAWTDRWTDRGMDKQCSCISRISIDEVKTYGEITKTSRDEQIIKKKRKNNKTTKGNAKNLNKISRMIQNNC